MSIAAARGLPGIRASQQLQLQQRQQQNTERTQMIERARSGIESAVKTANEMMKAHIERGGDPGDPRIAKSIMPLEQAAYGGAQALMQIDPGIDYLSSTRGQFEVIAGTTTLAQQNENKANETRATEAAKAEFDPVEVIDEDGNKVVVSKAEQLSRGLLEPEKTGTLSEFERLINDSVANGDMSESDAARMRLNRINKMSSESQGKTIEIQTEFGTVRVGEGNFGDYTSAVTGKPLPQVAQDSLNGAFNLLDSLDIMEAKVGVTGRGEGNLGRVQAALGFNPDAISFLEEQRQVRLSAQSLIKGIPSNFDAQLVIDTIPEIGQPEEVNKARIKIGRRISNQLIADTIAYYKYTGYVVPQRLRNKAEAVGINVDQLDTWSGVGDPLIKSLKIAQNSGIAKPITSMSKNEIMTLNVDLLSEDEKRELDSRLTELGY